LGCRKCEKPFASRKDAGGAEPAGGSALVVSIIKLSFK